MSAKWKPWRPYPLSCAIIAAAVAAAGLVSSCAIFSAAGHADEVFLKEEDPALAADALPSFIKLSEIILEGDPSNQGYVVTTASLYVMYASAFIEDPASLLPDARIDEREAANKRAGALYRRAFRLLAGALERHSPGLLSAVDAGTEGTGLARFGKADVPLLYWSSASVLAGFALDPMDFESAKHLKVASVLLARAAALDPGWNQGAIYALYLPYYASLPSYLGGDPAKAEEAYRKALEYSKGHSASLFVSYATSICVPQDDYPGFKAALERALAVDIDADPDSRLVNVLAREKARRLLGQADRYFTLPDGG